jgi:hypothetical protein
VIASFAYSSTSRIPSYPGTSISSQISMVSLTLSCSASFAIARHFCSCPSSRYQLTETVVEMQWVRTKSNDFASTHNSVVSYSTLLHTMFYVCGSQQPPTTFVQVGCILIARPTKRTWFRSHRQAWVSLREATSWYEDRRRRQIGRRYGLPGIPNCRVQVSW